MRPESRAAPRGRTTPLRAAALSALLPGLGHLRTAPKRGRHLVLVSIAVGLVVVGWLTTRSRNELMALTVHPRWLAVGIVVSLATLAARAAVAIDAVRRTRPAVDRSRWTAAVGLGLVGVVVAAPHLAVAVAAGQQLDVVDTIFVAGDTARPTPLPGEPPLPGESGSDIGGDGLAGPGPTLDSPSSETQPTTDRRSSTLVPAQPSPLAALEPPTPGSDDRATWDGEERLSILLLGGDGGYDRIGVRTDTIIVLSIDVESGDAIAFSVPRNWRDVPFPRGTRAAAAHPDGFDDLANAIYGYGGRHPELFPRSDDPAGTAIKQAMAQLLGIPINYYVLVDMRAVVDTVDLFGGLELTVTEPIRDGIGPIERGGPPLEIDVEPGRHHFDGMTTLAYARSRAQGSDYERMSRQRCVLGAVVDQVSAGEVTRHYRELMSIVRDHVRTDLPLDRLAELLDIADRLEPDRIRTVTFTPPEFPQRPLPLRQVRAEVRRLLEPAPAGRSTSGAGPGGEPVEDLTETCRATEAPTIRRR
ncbi:MAG: LCP family protein [Acidimicrobiales bacterium]